MSLFTTPLHQRIAELSETLQYQIERINCSELGKKGVAVCCQEVMDTVDNSFPTLGTQLTYSDGGSRGPYFIILATTSFTGSPDFFGIRPSNHFSRLPKAIIDGNSIIFQCVVEEGQSKSETVELASKELEFTNWYLAQLKDEWDAWYEKLSNDVSASLELKQATCQARAGFINALNTD